MVLSPTKGIYNIKSIRCARHGYRTTSHNLWLVVRDEKDHFKLILMQKNQ
jgi:hypothetical protein